MKLDDIYETARPKKIRVVLIGESPPALEKNLFFYAPNADLYNFTKQAFENVYGEKIKRALSFLDFFKDKGFFLDDLCRKPVNNIKDEYKREHERQNSISDLANRLTLYNPLVVIGIMKKIKYHIVEAIRLSKIEPKHIHYLGYPTHSRRNISNYVEGLEGIIRSLLKEGVID